MSRARLRPNSPLRQSGPRNGWVLQPGPARGSLPPSQPRHNPNRLLPGRDSRRAPASNHPRYPVPKNPAPASAQQSPAGSAGTPPTSPASPTRCSPPAFPTGAPETHASQRHKHPDKSPPEATPSAETLLLKRENQPPGYIENTIRKEGEKPPGSGDVRTRLPATTNRGRRETERTQAGQAEETGASGTGHTRTPECGAEDFKRGPSRAAYSVPSVPRGPRHLRRRPDYQHQNQGAQE